MTWTVQLSNGDSDLDGILALQRQNLEATVGAAAAERDGFVTAVHTRPLLAELHALCPSVVAKVGDTVVGYALVTPLEAGAIVPVLGPLIANIERLGLAGRAYIMGQVCIAPEQRGTGLFDALYDGHRRFFADRWELCVTDVALRNGRSLRAHERVGFERLLTYRDALDEWAMIGLRLGPKDP